MAVMALLLSLCIVLALVTAALSARVLVEAICLPRLPCDLQADRGCPATEDRVDDLLQAVLDEEEYGMLAARGHLDVVSPANAARIYRIPRYGGLVTVYEQDKAVLDLCLQPERPLPSGDVVVLHKLMIQANESEYLAIARPHPTLNPSRRYHR
jgi:hypothetical protein